MRVLPIFLLGAASALRTTETCALKWVEGCMAAPDEASCAACTKGLSADCPLLLQVLINQEVCNHAPFTTSTEECINAAVASCGSFTTSKKDCHACILKNSPKLKEANCTLVEVSVLYEVCNTVNGTVRSGI
jgi:hypothetical protein